VRASARTKKTDEDVSAAARHHSAPAGNRLAGAGEHVATLPPDRGCDMALHLAGKDRVLGE